MTIGQTLPLERWSVQFAHESIKSHIHLTPVITSTTLSNLASTPQTLEDLVGTPFEGQTPAHMRVGIRPEEIVLASSVAADERAATFEATVELIEAIGPRSVVSLVAASGPAMTAVVEARSATALREGASARFAVRHDALHFFPARHED